MTVKAELICHRCSTDGWPPNRCLVHTALTRLRRHWGVPHELSGPGSSTNRFHTSSLMAVKAGHYLLLREHVGAVKVRVLESDDARGSGTQSWGRIHAGYARD